MPSLKLNPVFAGAVALIDRIRSKNRLMLAESDRIDGKTCFVTGANSGLGFAIAANLAARGGRMIIAVRRELAETAEKLKKAAGTHNIEAMYLDLSRIHSIKALCECLIQREASLDICVLNAGICPKQSGKTQDGFDRAFQVNYIANYILARRLLKDGLIPNTTYAPRPAVKNHADTPPRIIFVSSESHKWCDPIDFSNFLAYQTFGMRKGVAHYALSKLYLQTFACELARRLNGGAHPEVSVFSLCPGAFRSNIARDLGAAADVFMRIFPKPETACLPAVYLSCSPDMAGQTQKYYHLHSEAGPAPSALDPVNGKRVWEMTEKMLLPFNVF